MFDGSTRIHVVYGSVVVLIAVFACGCGQEGGSQAYQPVSVRPAVVQSPDAEVSPKAVTEEPDRRQPRRALRGYLAWDMHESAAIALGRIGAAAVPDLVQALADPDPKVRLRAAEALARIGPEARESVPELIRLLSDEGEDEPTRKAAAWALGQIGPPAAGAVPELMRILQAPTAGVQETKNPNRGG